VQNITFNLIGLWIVKEISPVWIRLHVSEDEEFAQQQLQDDQGDVVPGFLVLNFGTLKTHDDFITRRITACLVNSIILHYLDLRRT